MAARRRPDLGRRDRTGTPVQAIHNVRSVVG
jgi:hypothetical protein